MKKEARFWHRPIADAPALRSYCHRFVIVKNKSGNYWEFWYNGNRQVTDLTFDLAVREIARYQKAGW